jgi:hypothetical protein
MIDLTQRRGNKAEVQNDAESSTPVAVVAEFVNSSYPLELPCLW